MFVSQTRTDIVFAPGGRCAVRRARGPRTYTELPTGMILRSGSLAGVSEARTGRSQEKPPRKLSTSFHERVVVGEAAEELAGELAPVAAQRVQALLDGARDELGVIAEPLDLVGVEHEPGGGAGLGDLEEPREVQEQALGVLDHAGLAEVVQGVAQA